MTAVESAIDGTHVNRPPGRPAAATKKEVLALARRPFLAGERLDVRSIATELGLSRATLYRWFGSRDNLAGAVIAAELEVLLSRADARHRQRGAARLLEVTEQVVRWLAGNDPLRRYLENEPMTALRVLTSTSGQVQQRAVAIFTELIARIEAEDGYQPAIERSTLAYVLVRLAEAFLYNDAAAGIRGDVDKLRDVVAVLLGLGPESTEA
ncbi:MAG: TetR family transcriptional regulator [Mycobacteriaceae bacterium]|nr:TetR family transcriptional regulator [Mycobacteriaceae bacterium]